jgi:hypothetical protein
MYQTIRVDRSAAEAMEWLGTKRKFWFSRGDVRWLLKAEERGTGEDWAEKVACELAARLGIPHVKYQLAEEYDGKTYLHPGVICPDFAGKPPNLILGNQLLWDRDSSYPKQDVQKYKVRAHTVDAVAACVGHLNPPANEWLIALPKGVSSALEIFTGYTMLDALIANQDRHHENWGAVRVPGESTLQLAPSFDHGASFARNLTDEERKDRLRSKDVRRQIPHFSQRARSSFYRDPSDSRPLSTLEAFNEFAQRAPSGARIWLDMLASVTENEICAIVDEVPSERMSPIAKEFTIELILINRNRLLNR